MLQPYTLRDPSIQGKTGLFASYFDVKILYKCSLDNNMTQLEAKH